MKQQPPAFQFGPGFRWVRYGSWATAGLLVVWLVIWLGFGGRADYVDGPPHGWAVAAGAWAGFGALGLAALTGIFFAQQLVLAILERIDAGPLFPGLLGRRGGGRTPFSPSKKDSNP